MTYTLNSKDAAVRAANELNTVQGDMLRCRYEAMQYPDGRPGHTPAIRAYWPWGVGRYVLNYHADGAERFDGFVWMRLPS